MDREPGLIMTDLGFYVSIIRNHPAQLLKPVE